MSELNKIYYALMSGKAAAESLATWVRRAEGYDLVRSYENDIREGVAAYERLSRDLKDGRKHIAPPVDYDPPPRTECYCSEPTCSPPCSWCTSGKEREEDDEAAAMGKEAGK